MQCCLTWSFAVFPGFLFRLLPMYGRLYVSDSYFCFKSSGPLTSRTKVRILASELQPHG